MNSIIIESATKFGPCHNSKHKILIGSRPRKLLTLYKQGAWQILMHISVQVVANPHAHFYVSVNKDDNQMSNIL